MKLPFNILLAVLLLPASTLFAQSDIPVDLYSGKPQVNIPLGEVRERDLVVPLGISYNGDGVRVNEQPARSGLGSSNGYYGSAGLGWTFFAGGAISRQVRALPDDYNGGSTDARRGWLTGTNAQDIGSFAVTADDDLSSCLDESANWNTINNFGSWKDTEPDVFSFNAGGYSGQFVFDNNQQVRTIPYLDVLITPYFGNNNDIYKFEITTNTGIKYTFSDLEKTTKWTQTYYPYNNVDDFQKEYNLYRSHLTFTSQWHLTSILSPSGANVSFSYTSYESQDEIPMATVNETSSFRSQYAIYTTITKKSLSQIYAPSSKAIIYSYYGNLSKIDLYNSTSGVDKFIKRFQLGYATVSSSNNPKNLPSSRAFLRSITESQSGCDAFPPYLFDYYGVDWGTRKTLLPPFESSMQDLWGYFNNRATSLVPTVYVYDKSGAERYRIEPLPGISPYVTLAGADRSVNPGSVYVGSLAKVTFPPGGCTTIEYEPHDYYDAPADRTFLGGGIRVKRVTVHDGISHSNNQVREYDYRASTGHSSGKFTYRPVFAFPTLNATLRTTQNLAPEMGLGYEQVTVKESGRGKVVYNFSMGSTYPATNQGDWTATWTKVVRSYSSPCQSLGNIRPGYYTFPFPPNTNYDFERGLLSRKYEHSESGQLLRETQYDYQRLSPGTITVKGLQYEKIAYATVFGYYSMLAQVGKVLLTEKVYTTDPTSTALKLESAFSYYYDNPNHKLLSRTTTQNSDGTVYKIRYKYAKDYTGITSGADAHTAALKRMHDNFMHGIVIEKITSVIKGSTENVISTALTRFDGFGTSRVLPAQLLRFPTVTGFSESYIQNDGTSQTFKSDTRYLPVRNFESYDDRSNLLTLNDGRKNRQAFHWGYNKTVPVVEIAHASAGQVVYSGFETSTGYDFTHTLSSYSPGWTGTKALDVPAGALLQKTLEKGSGKFYRFTCRVKSSTSGLFTINLLSGTTIQATTTVNYNSGDWQYLEKQVDMSAVSNSFTIQLSSSSAVTVDDIAFYPAVANVITSTYELPYGRTSQTDDKGVSIFYEFDPLGRLKYVRNQDKNIIMKNEYKYHTDPAPTLKSSFSYPDSNNDIYAGDQITFTAESSCMDGVTHTWYVNTMQVATSQAFTYSFPATGDYTIKHVAYHPSHGSSASEVVLRVKAMASIYTEGNKTVSSCDPSGKRIFYAEVFGCPTSNVTYQWQNSSMYGWVDIPGATGASLTQCANYATFSVRCVTTGCNQTATSNEITITYVDGGCPIDDDHCN